METTTPNRSLRVLVVDDNPDAADSMALVLRQAGHEARVAWNGEDALVAALESRPDVVLLDLGMPCMNGFETARRLRETQDGRPPVLVAVTGWGTEEDRQRTQAAGFAHHLVKPVDPADVLAIVAGAGSD
jgi:CheY-like chemotaxis protein